MFIINALMVAILAIIDTLLFNPAINYIFLLLCLMGFLFFVENAETFLQKPIDKLIRWWYNTINPREKERGNENEDDLV